ncbi:ATP-binding protein [Halorussus caseinilyticus]|uniref:ATP-binding protein n=1 Tax=Halorussus caseinilyticus TaxID=3034025 RepID=A0ABD5WT49_9EURY|nr:ATP-binding protein [Halorussus sp. DT72]
MTELEHVEIEGFKGLEYVEFEPTDINLITGRNNTGKTSLLEAVDLLFEPVNLQEFDDNLDSVINTKFDSAEISGESDSASFEANIRKPSLSEAENLFFEIASNTGGFQMSLAQFTTDEKSEVPSEEKADAPRQIYENIRNSLVDAIREKLVREPTEGLRDEILILSTADREYPCFLSGKRSTTLIRDILEDVVDEFRGSEKIDNLGFYHNQRGPRGYFEFSSRRVELGLPPRNTFVERPTPTNLTTFIKSTATTDDIKRTDDNQESVKIDDIGDFIQERDIVDNLKSFSLDTLIFETEDGEKEPIPFDFMGDGFKAIVGLLWELMDDDVENQIVLIEEPENHMHPGYVLKLVHFLIDLARDENVQFFITTHDHDFIKDFFADMPDEKRDYLEDEFSLVKMDDFGAEVLDYETAEHDLKDLHLDLRGI